MKINPSRVLESSPVHEAEEAGEYERMVEGHAWLLNRPFVKILGRLDLEHARVLDVGTGPGLIPVELARLKPSWEIWALDPSEDMLAQARRRAEAAGVSDRVHFVPGEAAELPFEDGRFDLTVSHFVLHHMNRPQQMFDEMARVTRGDGKVIIKDLRRQPRWKSKLLLWFSRRFLGYSHAQLQMYWDSLRAAMTIREVREALRDSKLSAAEVRGFRGVDFILET